MELKGWFWIFAMIEAISIIFIFWEEIMLKVGFLGLVFVASIIGVQWVIFTASNKK